MIRKTLKSLKIVIALALGLAAMAGPGEAVPLSTYTGNSFLSSAGVDGTVNYAVFTSANFSTDATAIIGSRVLGTGSADLDLGPGIYVYVFQVANNGSNTSSITQFSAGRSMASSVDVTSWGHFAGAVLTDPGGNVGAGNSMDPGATSVGFVADGGVNPFSVSKSSSSLVTTFSSPNLIVAGGTSSVMWYTSHSGPDWFSGQIGLGAMGSVPGPLVPAPATLLLMTTGLAGLVRFGRGMYRKGGGR